MANIGPQDCEFCNHSNIFMPYSGYGLVSMPHLLYVTKVFIQSFFRYILTFSLWFHFYLHILFCCYYLRLHNSRMFCVGHTNARGL